jgi:excisionase family DNA binding protein
MNNPFEALDMRLQNIERYLELLTQTNPLPAIAAVTDEIKFSQEELAKYLGVSRTTVHRYQKNNLFRSYKAGRTVFFKKDEVDAAMCSEQPKKKKGGSTNG